MTKPPTHQVGRLVRLVTSIAAAAVPLVVIGGTLAAATPTAPTSAPTSAPSVCPVPMVPPAYVRSVTATSATIYYYGINIPQCSFPSGTPTLAVRLAGDAWNGITPPLRTVTGPDGGGSGELTVTGLHPGTAYEWRLTSTGPGIPASRGTFTTSTTGPTPTSTPSPTSTPTPTPTTRPACPMYTIRPPWPGEVTATTAVIHYSGVTIPECGYHAGTPTLTVRRADRPNSPVTTLVGPRDVSSGSFTVRGLLPSTRYAWQLTSTGNIRSGSGTFTTLPAAPPTSVSAKG